MRILTKALAIVALAAVAALLVPAGAARANGAASTRNIIFGTAAAAALTAEQERTIGELGREADERLHPAAEPPRRPDAPPRDPVPAPLPPPAPQQPPVQPLEPALQPPLAPLLVCAALAARQARRRRQHGGNSHTMRPSAWTVLADNIAAWRIARAAHRRHLQLQELMNGTGSP